MTNHVLSKPVITKKERTVLIEFANAQTLDAREMLLLEVMSIEQSKTDLSKYAVIISSNDKKIEMSAETFLYQLTNKRKTKLNDNIKYKRKNLQEIEFYIDGSSVPVKINSYEEIRQSVHAILKRNFQFFNEIFETYDYLYSIPLFNLYKESYEDSREACEKFYEIINNKLKTTSLDEFIEMCEDVRTFSVSENFGVTFADSKEKAKYSDSLCERFADCVKNAVPHHFSRYVLAEYFTDDQIFACYGGQEKAIEYLENALHTTIMDLKDAVILLKKLTFDKENKQFDSKVYMRQLVSTIVGKSKEIFGGEKIKKTKWSSYSDMIYYTVSELMRLEKDKTTL